MKEKFLEDLVIENQNSKSRRKITWANISVFFAVFTIIILAIPFLTDKPFEFITLIFILQTIVFLFVNNNFEKMEALNLDIESSLNIFRNYLQSKYAIYLIIDHNKQLIECDSKVLQITKRHDTAEVLNSTLHHFGASKKDIKEINSIIFNDSIKSIHDKTRSFGPFKFNSKNYYISLSAFAGNFLVSVSQSSSHGISDIDNSFIGYYELDGDLNVVNANNYFYKVLGSSQDEINSSGINFADIIDIKKESSSSYKFWDQSFANWQGIVTIKTKFKERISAFILQKSFFDTLGDVSQISGFMIKLNEGGDSVQQQGFEKGWIDYSWQCFFENSPYPVAILDLDGTILRINQAFVNLLAEDHLNENFTVLFDEIDREVIKKEMLSAVIKNDKNVEPLKNIKLNNINKYFDVYLGKIVDLQDNMYGFMVRVADITHQKELEDNLSHAQRMQIIGNFAGSIAHDFNNLLTAILGFSEILLMRHTVGDPSFSSLLQIKQSADKASNLVRRLLAFSRKQTMDLQLINLSEWFSDTKILIQRLIGLDLNVDINVDREIWPIRFDPVQLEQIILNLAVNSSHALASNGLLNIRAFNAHLTEDDKMYADYILPVGEKFPEEGDYVLLEFTDNGAGIKKDIIQKIFEPFFTTKDDKSGTGLGLATVYGIVRQSDGYIMVKSSTGKGTTFLICLKRSIISEADIAKILDNKGVIKEESLFGRETILLVEDEEAVRIFTKAALESKGYKVIEYESAKIALANLEIKMPKIDLVITDVMMPELNGPTFITKLQKNYNNLKVVFVSGYGEDAFSAEYGAKRDFYFVAKPFTMKQLLLKVKEILKK